VSRNSNNFSIRDLIGNADLQEFEEVFGDTPLDALTVQECAELIRRKPSVISAWIQNGSLENLGTRAEPLVDRAALLSVNQRVRSRSQSSTTTPVQSTKKNQSKPNAPTKKKRHKPRKTGRPKRPEELLGIQQIARILNVNTEVIRVCVRRGLVPAFAGSRGEPAVRLSDFTSRDFRTKLDGIQQELDRKKRESKSSRSSVASKDIAPSARRIYDPERVVVPAMLHRLKQIDKIVSLDNALLNERAYLRSEIRRRDPEAFAEYLATLT